MTLFLTMTPRKPHTPEVPADTEPASAKRNKLDVTIDRIMALSPASLKELAQKLRAHDQGAYVIDIMQRAWSAPREQPSLPFERRTNSHDGEAE